MKEFKLEDIAPVTDLQNKVWQVIDLFRGSIETINFPIILFLLSLQKDDVLNELDLSKRESLKDEFHRAILNISNENYEAYRTLYKFYEPLIHSLNEEQFTLSIQILGSLNQSVLKEHFALIFDDLLYKLSKFQGRLAGESLMPMELCRFMCGLAELPKNAKVYNPFAGLASFAVFLGEGQDYIGQEINSTTWAFGSLRILANQRPCASSYILGDSINNWNPIRKYRSNKPEDILKYPSESEIYDLIISNPPYGVRLREAFSGRTGNIRTVEHFLIEKGIEDLKRNGKLIIALPQGFLFNSSEQNIRQYLIESDLLEMVISFPSGLMMNTGIPVAVIVINKAKEKKGSVRFIDAKKFVEESNGREKRLNDYALNSIVRSSNESDALRIVTIDTIRDLGFNLNVPRYFQKEYEGVKLGELGSIIRGQRVSDEQIGKFIRIRDLKEDILDNNLNITNLEDVKLPRNVQRINESSLLLAARGKTLRPTYFKYQGIPIYLTPDTIAFKVDETIVDVNYLTNELYASYIIEQLESFKIGSVFPTIRKADLLEVKIKLPSLHYQNKFEESIGEQKAKIEGLKEASVKMKLLQAERNALAHGMGNLLYENFASVKHSLGKPLLNIGSSLRNIESALAKLDKEWEKIKLSEKHDITLKDSFDSIYSNLKLVHSLLKNNEGEFDVTNYKLTELDFIRFTKAYVKKIKSAEKPNVQIVLDLHPDLIENFGKKLMINANAELLEILLNNTVENANMHAFTDSSKKYKLEFRLSLQLGSSEKPDLDETIGSFQSFVKIEIANNGLAFPENFTLEKFIRKNSYAGKTANTGIGGYVINEIVKYHNDGKSTFDLITKDFSTEFVTTYVLLIPITN